MSRTLSAVALFLALACSRGGVHVQNDSGMTASDDGEDRTSGRDGGSGDLLTPADSIGAPVDDVAIATLDGSSAGEVGVVIPSDSGISREIGPRTYPPPPDGGGPGSMGGMSDVDGGCSFEHYWFFPDEQGASFCGTIGDACTNVCGTSRGCIVDIEHGVPIQQVYCPQDTVDGGTKPRP